MEMLSVLGYGPIPSKLRVHPSRLGGQRAGQTGSQDKRRDPRFHLFLPANGRTVTEDRQHPSQLSKICPFSDLQAFARWVAVKL